MATSLGKITSYSEEYNPELLEFIPRSQGRSILPSNISFEGSDLWTCYEFSWLNGNGKPCNKILRMEYPASSTHIVESKSLKLFLGGFAFKKFENEKDVVFCIRKDLLSGLGASSIEISLLSINDDPNFLVKGRCLDEFQIQAPEFSYDATLLKSDKSRVEESVCSHLFRSLCPVTGQPDWASIQIEYKGKKINDESLLRYLFSLRRHQGFHEQCCEVILSDIAQQCEPEQLSVTCFFTRRGGISIWPSRIAAETSLDI